MNRKKFFKDAIGAAVAVAVGSKLDFIPEVPKDEDYLMWGPARGSIRCNLPSRDYPFESYRLVFLDFSDPNEKIEPILLK